MIFNEDKLQEEIIKTWGEFGVHNEVFNAMRKQISDLKQLTLTDVVNCVYVVTERDNYGDQTFKGVFKNKEQALKFLAKDGLTESNIDEINEIELE